MTLADASSWIEFLRGRSSEPRQRVKSLLASGHAAWCEFTLVELWNGAQGHVEKRALEELEAEVQLCAVNAPIWAIARLLAWRSREKGVTAASGDLVVAT
jgi:predicted nucleic acid-binding protein